MPLVNPTMPQDSANQGINGPDVMPFRTEDEVRHIFGDQRHADAGRRADERRPSERCSNRARAAFPIVLDLRHDGMRVATIGLINSWLGLIATSRATS